MGRVGSGIGLGSLGMQLNLSGCGSSTPSDVVPPSNRNTWEEIRNQDFQLSSDFIYMNNSTLGATLKPVREKMNQVQEIFSEGPNLNLFVFDIVMKINPIRELGSQLFNAYGANYIGFVDSVTEGMSLVANGLTFESGDVILTTDHEHPGGLYCWKLQSDRYGAELVEIPLIGEHYQEDSWQEKLLGRFEAALKQYAGAVKVVSFSYITTSTGHILPAKQLCALAHQYGAIAVIDAAQACTVIPVDVQALDCDFYVVNGHKYMCGAVGTGTVAVNSNRVEVNYPFWGTVVDSNNYIPEDPSKDHPWRKGGVRAYTMLPLEDALTFYQNLGAQRVYDRLLCIGEWMRTGLSRYPDTFELITPTEEELSCVMTCFRVNGMSSSDVVDSLANTYQIYGKHATEGGADAVRLSPHYYNMDHEFDSLARAVCEIGGVDPSDWFLDNDISECSKF